MKACTQCGGRLRFHAEVELRPNTLVGYVDVCQGCGEEVDGLLMCVCEDGTERAMDAEECFDAGQEVADRWDTYWPRIAWLRRCRDRACLRWSSTSDVRWLQLARKVESARRRAMVSLRVERDVDRVDLGSSHVETMALLRLNIIHMSAAPATILRAQGVQVEVGLGSATLSDGIREAATMGGFFEEWTPGKTHSA